MTKLKLAGLFGLVSVALASALIGCKKEVPTVSSPPIDQRKDGPPGIAPMTSAPLPGAPIAGSDTVTGAGSGAGQVMKGRARDVAAGSPSSIDQGSEDDDPDPDGQ